MRKFIRLSAMGISMGCTTFVCIGIIFSLTYGSDMVFTNENYGFIKMAVCSMVVGLGFSLPSLVFDWGRLAGALQALIHLATGFTVFGAVAIYAKWIPVAGGGAAIVIFVVGSIAITMLVWGCFYLYYKKEAARINKGIRNK